MVKNMEHQRNGESLLSGVWARGRESGSEEESARGTEPAKAEMCNCAFLEQEFPTLRDRTENVPQAGKHLPPPWLR